MSELTAQGPGGRPERYGFEKQRFIELRRLTGCGAVQLEKGVRRIQAGGALLWFEVPALKTINRAIKVVQDDGKPGFLSSIRQGLPPRYFLHVVPIILGDRGCCDLALMYEPLSFAAFAEINLDFQTPHRLSDFVTRSLKRLPRPLTDALAGIELTQPLTQHARHWTTDPVRRRLVLAEGFKTPDKRRLSIVDAPRKTGPLQTLDFRGKTDPVLTVGTLQQHLKAMLNAYNLGNKPDGIDFVYRAPMHGTWSNKQRLVLNPLFNKSPAISWPPLKRLRSVCECYVSPLTPVPGTIAAKPSDATKSLVEQIVKDLRYR